MCVCVVVVFVGSGNAELAVMALWKTWLKWYNEFKRCVYSSTCLCYALADGKARAPRGKPEAGRAGRGKCERASRFRLSGERQRRGRGEVNKGGAEEATDLHKGGSVCVRAAAPGPVRETRARASLRVLQRGRTGSRRSRRKQRE